MNEILFKNIFGDGDPGMLISAFFWALVGVSISLMYEGAKRDPNNPRTPYTFKLSFLILDNGKRIIRNLLVIISVLVFSQQVLGVPLNNFVGFGIGLGLDRIVSMILNLKTPKKDE